MALDRNAVEEMRGEEKGTESHRTSIGWQCFGDETLCGGGAKTGNGKAGRSIVWARSSQ